jgi:hypothetical protein
MRALPATPVAARRRRSKRESWLSSVVWSRVRYGPAAGFPQRPKPSVERIRTPFHPATRRALLYPRATTSLGVRMIWFEGSVDAVNVGLEPSGIPHSSSLEGELPGISGAGTSRGSGVPSTTGARWVLHNRPAVSVIGPDRMRRTARLAAVRFSSGGTHRSR